MKETINKGCGCNIDIEDIKSQCNVIDACNCNKEEVCQEQCMNEESIFFSGLCNPEDFNIDNGLWTEQSISGSIYVPFQKPLIEEIDSVNAKIEIVSKKVIVTPGVVNKNIYNYEGKISTGRKLIIEGLVCLTTSYVSTNKNQSVHSFHGKVPFSAFIVLPYTSGTGVIDPLDINFIVSACIEEVCIKSICDRAVNLTVTFVLSATKGISSCNKSYFADSGIDCSVNSANSGEQCPACTESNKAVIAGVCSTAKIQTLLTEILDDEDNPIPQLWTEISIPEVLTIPSVKPDVDQILSVNSNIKILCQKVIETPVAIGANLENFNLTGKKIIIEAVLSQRITYVSKTDCQSVHAAHFNVPVSAYIMAPDTTELTDKFKIIACLEDIYACVLNDRQIFKNSTLFLKALPIKCQI